MNNILLSICISSYNHGDKCVQLVNHILSVKDKRFNIVICDDCSNEDTIRVLNSLSDSRVTLMQNKDNLGPCKNWFKTINSGTGQYILHILDRDMISINYLPVVLDILEKNSVGGGYFGRSALYPVKEIVKREGYAICSKGREAFLTMAGVPIHPTGFFIRRILWEHKNYKKFFYQSAKYGIYPHSYVLGEIAVNNDMIYSPIPFYTFSYRGSTKISKFYEKENNKGYWWLPKNTISTDNRLMIYLSGIAGDSYKGEFICRRFRDALNRATFVYKKVAASQSEMEHYGFSPSYISAWELLKVSIKYKFIFTRVLKLMDINEKEIQKKIQKIWINNLNAILKELKGNKVERMVRINNKNFAQFQIMNQWVKAKQRESRLDVYFERKGYKRIAIYGMGLMGETLLDELQATNIEVTYGIDQSADITYTNIPVCSLEDNFLQVDAVVVTVIEEFSRIEKSLKEKINCPIISLQDVIYDI